MKPVGQSTFGAPSLDETCLVQANRHPGDRWSIGPRLNSQYATVHPFSALPSCIKPAPFHGLLHRLGGVAPHLSPLSTFRSFDPALNEAARLKPWSLFSLSHAFFTAGRDSGLAVRSPVISSEPPSGVSVAKQAERSECQAERMRNDAQRGRDEEHDLTPIRVIAPTSFPLSMPSLEETP